METWQQANVAQLARVRKRLGQTLLRQLGNVLLWTFVFGIFVLMWFMTEHDAAPKETFRYAGSCVLGGMLLLGTGGSACWLARRYFRRLHGRVSLAEAICVQKECVHTRSRRSHYANLRFQDGTTAENVRVSEELYELLTPETPLIAARVECEPVGAEEAGEADVVEVFLAAEFPL